METVSEKMTNLVKTNEPQAKWYPVSIKRLDDYLIRAIHIGKGYRNVYALRKNLAYNLQYLEYLDRTAVDLKLSEVIYAQTWKTFIIVGCGVVESLLYYLLVTKDLHSKCDLELVAETLSNPTKMEGETRLIKSKIFRKLTHPKTVQMSFESMLKKAEAKKIFGPDHAIYSKLNYLRGLRNKVHLHESSHEYDTDWNCFSWSSVCAMAEVLYGIFASKIFSPSKEELTYFSYLLRYKERPSLILGDT